MSTFAEEDYNEEIFDQMRKIAKNGWENQFIDDMEEKHEKYGDNTYVSERQCEIINDMLKRYTLRNQ